MEIIRSLKAYMIDRLFKKHKASPELIEQGQDLGVYWDQNMAAVLETWGKDHVWNEFQMFLAGRSGRVLDIACGTGVTILLAQKNKNLEVYGCDISDFLINKAKERGIDSKFLAVCDATNMKIYDNDFFNYSYSIGSLEHFTEAGMQDFISETHRITKSISFHMMPVSRNGINNGWIKVIQSYFNNSVKWWEDKFKVSYSEVYVIDSGWKDDLSIGKWFICIK